ncbi:hypothetical protein R3P38DRAFT_3191651 [Favolaschia claudopus]|uniref:Uncharacterized protein n=1 Tax=Favolaschia claudopus TaxID=2862362 RepID=A0AAW0BL60_9AGAR
MAYPGMQRTRRPRPSLATRQAPPPQRTSPPFLSVDPVTPTASISKPAEPAFSLKTLTTSLPSHTDSNRSVGRHVSVGEPQSRPSLCTTSHRLLRGDGAAFQSPHPLTPCFQPTSPPPSSPPLPRRRPSRTWRQRVPSECYTGIEPRPFDPYAAAAIPPCTHRRSVRGLLVRSLTTLGPTPSPVRSPALRQDEGKQRQHHRLGKRVAYLPAPLGRAGMRRTIHTRPTTHLLSSSTPATAVRARSPSGLKELSTRDLNSKVSAVNAFELNKLQSTQM